MKKKTSCFRRSYLIGVNKKQDLSVFANVKHFVGESDMIVSCRGRNYNFEIKQGFHKLEKKVATFVSF